MTNMAIVRTSWHVSIGKTLTALIYASSLLIALAIRLALWKIRYVGRQGGRPSNHLHHFRWLNGLITGLSQTQTSDFLLFLPERLIYWFLSSYKTEPYKCQPIGDPPIRSHRRALDTEKQQNRNPLIKTLLHSAPWSKTAQGSLNLVNKMLL